MTTDELMELVASAREGQRVALARLMSIVERGGPPARRLGSLAFGGSGDAHVVGVTGAPGAGKSTLTNALVRRARAGGERLGVLAVDPSSPFTGGAILGDRIRMQEHATDDGVYIRSMATRGHLGGLSLATPQAVRLLDALGWPWIVVETVGVGQVEVEVAGEADTTVVVVNPGWGDAVQASKAGLLEVADVFVVNKADRPGAEDTRRDLHQMLERSADRDWVPPVVSTVATEADGVDALWDEIGRHRAHLVGRGQLEPRRARRRRDELTRILRHIVEDRLDVSGRGPQAALVLEQLDRRQLDLYAAADRLLALAGLEPVDADDS